MRPHLAKTYCRLHYGRVRETGEPGVVDPTTRKPLVTEGDMCGVLGCGSTKYRARSYCNMHYLRLYKTGSTEAPPEKRSAHWTDISGHRFGTLVARSYDPSTLSWTLDCDCGETRKTRYWNLKKEGGRSTCGDRIIHINLDLAPSYSLAHQRVRLFRGRASEHLCFGGCGNQGKQWAYDHTDDNEHSVQGSSKNLIFYSMDISKYHPMCVRCHKNFDLGHIKKMDTVE